MTHPAFQIHTSYRVEYLLCDHIHTDIRVSRSGWYVVERTTQGRALVNIAARYCASEAEAKTLAAELRGEAK